MAHVLVAVTEDRHAVLGAGHQMLDFGRQKIPFYANMFSNAGFSLIISDQAVPDALVDNLVISGNESTINAQFAEILSGRSGRVLMVSLVPTTGGSDDEPGTTHAFDRSTIMWYTEETWNEEVAKNAEQFRKLIKST